MEKSLFHHVMSGAFLRPIRDVISSSVGRKET